ncbi:MAG: 50S ribosomal protein L21 [Patescibacteria group bacterium]|jgi:large subunit ribosomal protein L21
MKIAVIKTGGKQYTVAAKDKVKIEKINAKQGDNFEFNDVLLVADGDDVKVGKPVVSGAKVIAKIVKQGRAEKVSVVKYKRKTRYRKNVGHRQSFTEIQIEKID